MFVSTSRFTGTVMDDVARSPKQIVLIDGGEPERLMVRHGIEVRTQVQYDIKHIDEDYFDQETM